MGVVVAIANKHILLFVFLIVLVGMGLILPIMEQAFSPAESTSEYDLDNIVDFDSEASSDLDIFTIGGNNFFVKFLNIVFIGFGNIPFFLVAILWVIRIIIIAILIDLIPFT